MTEISFEALFTLSLAFHSALWKLITAQIYYLEIWWSFFRGTPLTISNVKIATPKYTANIFFPGLNWGVSCSAVIFHYVQLWLVLEIFTASHLHTDTLNSTAHTFFLLLILTVFELVNKLSNVWLFSFSKMKSSHEMLRFRIDYIVISIGFWKMTLFKYNFYINLIQSPPFSSFHTLFLFKIPQHFRRLELHRNTEVCNRV